MSGELPFPLVQACWAKVLKVGEEDPSKAFGSVFYKTLFEDFPFLKETDFKKAEVSEQKMNLTKFLTVALSLLGDMDAAVEALTQLGLRHITYGTQEAHYPVVGANLVKTLGIILGNDAVLSEACVAEWLALYEVIQNTIVASYHCERAIPFWKRLYKRRNKELQTALAGVDASKYGVPAADLTAAIATLGAEQSMAGFEKIASKLSADQLKNLGANLVAAAEAKNSSITAYDKWAINWVGSHTQEVVAKTHGVAACATKKATTDSSCSTCCTKKTCWITCAVVVGAVAAGAFFFLKKKNN